MVERVSVHSPELYEICRKHFNEPMIATTNDQIVRCVGYAETGIDCYIIVRRKGGELYWNTCVGGYTFLDRLKGQNKAGKYDDLIRLDLMLEQCGAPKEPEFILDLRHEEMEDHFYPRAGEQS